MKTILSLALFVSIFPALAFAADAPSSCGSDEAGFVSLFDGKTLNGWQGSTDGYAVEDGMLVCVENKGGVLFTNKEYANYAFRFEFRLNPGANNGIALRYPGKGNGAYAGMESQVLDHTAKKYANLKKYQYHGSIYGLLPAKTGFLKPVGEWNSEEIRLDGSKVQVVLNGTVIVEGDLAKIDKPMDGRDHPGKDRKSGYLGFLGHGDRLEFRNIRIKELP